MIACSQGFGATESGAYDQGKPAKRDRGRCNFSLKFVDVLTFLVRCFRICRHYA